MFGPRIGVTSFIAAGLVTATTLAAGLPAFAQEAPGGASAWSKGPGAAGDNTYVGRVEAPRAGQRVADGANLLVSGWAADTTARGWAGFDALEIWSGQKDASDATKLATGSVGLARPDLAEALGGTYARAGFSAAVPASSLTKLTPGKQDLGVYLHTPDKGWWHRSVSITLAAAPTNAGAEPINVILRPLDGSIISDKQKFEKFTFFGYALDQTPITDSGNQTLGSCECGIASVTMYVDSIDAAHNLGSAAVGGLTVSIGNKGKPASQSVANFSPVSREYGTQYDHAGWAFSINPREFSADWHTFYAVARSSITGKTSTASVTMLIKDIPENLKIVVP